MEVKDNYFEIYNNGHKIVLNVLNGHYIILNKDLCIDYSKNEILNELGFNKLPSDNTELFENRIVTISLMVSNQGYLACEYCFNKDKNNNSMSYDKAIQFIDYIIKPFPPNSPKFFVDCTGCRELLLALPVILKIGDYCKSKSNLIKKAIIPMVATNGVLLTNNINNLLRKHNFLVGITSTKRTLNNYYSEIPISIEKSRQYCSGLCYKTYNYESNKNLAILFDAEQDTNNTIYSNFHLWFSGTYVSQLNLIEPIALIF